MFAQKPPVPPNSDINYGEQLKYLYARRTRLDALIESLQEYDRFRAQRAFEQYRKLA
jgi:hypothetical protein